MPVTYVANGIIIFVEMNFGMVKEFDIQLYILGHGRDYIDIVCWLESLVLWGLEDKI